MRRRGADRSRAERSRAEPTGNEGIRAGKDRTGTGIATKKSESKKNMKIEKVKFTFTFTEPVLGMTCNNRDVYTEFIAAKAPTTTKGDEETAALPAREIEQKALTVFPKDDKGMFFWDYQIRGFFKDTIIKMIELGTCKLSKWGYKKAVDSFLFVENRRNYLQRDGVNLTKPDGIEQRPLRAETMQGDRVALAMSEKVDPGTSLSFVVQILMGDNAKSRLAVFDQEMVVAIVDHASKWVGFGQWRSGGNGRFTFTYEHN